MKRILTRSFIILGVICLASFAFISFSSKDKSKATVGINIGDTAPDISLTDPQGKTVKLSSLRGKYVVLDFWASWCPPCRRANPALVRMYKTYSSRKFENGSGLAIYSVSLDKDKAAWQAAIKADQLDWQEHVCELAGWQSKTAAVFGVESIPTNFILDGDGKIIARDLMDDALNRFLSSKEKK